MVQRRHARIGRLALRAGRHRRRLHAPRDLREAHGRAGATRSLARLFRTRSARRLPASLINLPNKAYWLAPERQAASLASLGRFGAVVACATALLLCLVHGMVMQANRIQPPHLEMMPLIGVLVLFFAMLVVAMAVFLGRFFRAP